jgi:serine/threonine protein kinase
MLDKEATTEEWLKGHAPIGSGASLPDGTEVGRWRIVAFIARGGSGEVYRAVEVDGQRMAALKILHRTDAAAVARFAREVQVLSELRDRAFPVFFESGTFGGRPWYATEFLQPLDMPATDRAVARFIVAVCRGAGALHKLGYVHRDIKPANILFRKDEPVLIDLGLLKKAETPALHTGGTVSVVDGRPVGVGTPGYAAPEQFMGGGISPATDIHAIGVLASVCFGGRPPRAWRAIIRRATSSLPGERYPDVAALARAVRLRHLPTTLGAAAVAVAIVALAVFAAMWPRKAPQPQPGQVVDTRETIVSASSTALPMQTSAAAVESTIDPPPAPEPAPKPDTVSNAEAQTEAGMPDPRLESASIETRPRKTRPIVVENVGSIIPGSTTVFTGPDDNEPIVSSERLRNKLADQGRILPNVTPNQIREVLDKLEKGMVPIPSRDFEICKFELTQSIWMPIAGFNPSKEVGPDIPVSNVTMADIEEFLESLNDLPEVRASGRKYRLPTAEEWEYACLAGGTNGFCRLADGTQITPETLGEVAWFAGNSGDKPHPVCTKAPNAFGLYDMHGNVAEFTSTRRPNDMFEYIWKGNAYNGEKPNGFRADLSPSLTYGISYYIAGFRLAR